MEDLQKAVKTCFAKYADFSGRAARPEFWWFALFQFVLVLVLGFVSNTLSMLASLGLLLPGLAVGARRLHDINKSGWLMLLWLIPLLGWIAMIYLSVQPGDASSNRFGVPPAAGDTGALAPTQQ